MKYKKRIANLKARIEDFERSPVIQRANQRSPGAYKKPGSQQ